MRKSNRKEIKKGIFSIIILILITIFILKVYAESPPQPTPWSRNPWSILTEPLLKIGVDWYKKGWILTTIMKANDFFNSVYKNLPYLILSNPDIEDISVGMKFFINITAPFYILGIIFTSFYLLFVSSSPEGRANAKQNLFNMFISLILVSLSPLLLSLLFYFSATATKFLLNVVDTKTAIETLFRAMDWFYGKIWKAELLQTGGFGSGVLLGIYLAIYPLFYLLTVGRYVFLVLLGMLLPLAILMNSFYATKGLGKTLWFQLIMVTSVQILWAVALAVIVVIITTLPYQISTIPQEHIDLACWFFFVFSPMIILGIADWFAILVVIIDALTTGPYCVGPVVMDELYIGREILPEEVTADVADM